MVADASCNLNENNKVLQTHTRVNLVMDIQCFTAGIRTNLDLQIKRKMNIAENFIFFVSSGHEFENIPTSCNIKHQGLL